MKTVQLSLRRRFALLATSSFGALSIMTCAGGAAALLPSTALAADECGVQAADGDAIVCPAGTYPTGISYSGGTVPLTLQDAVSVTDGGFRIDASTAISVGVQSIVEGGAPQITNSTGAGMSLISGGSVDVNLWPWDIDGSDGFITGTTGLVVSAAGAAYVNSFVDIPITATDPTGTGLVISTGPSYSSIWWQGSITSAGTGVRAHNADGTLAITVGSVTAVGDGIVAEGSGTGSVYVYTGPVTAGGAGVSVTTESGDAQVTLNGNVMAAGGKAVVINSGGSAFLTIGTGVSLTSSDVDITGVNTVDYVIGGTFSSLAGMAQDVVIQPSAFTASLVVSGQLTGAVDFRGISNGTSTDIQSGGRWHLADQSFLSLGDDVLRNAPQVTAAAVGTILADPDAVLDFGAGQDAFYNGGFIVFDGDLKLENLETFENVTLIAFGGSDGRTSDGQPNDRLVVDGTAFVAGSYQNPWDISAPTRSALLLDVDFATNQNNCSAAVAADCLSLLGGSTAGETLLRVNRVGAGLPTLGSHIVLIDVAGGTSAAEHFVLDSASPGYTDNEILGPGFDTGLLFVKLAYDPSAQQHYLMAIPNRPAYQMAVLPTAAQTLWHTSVGAWEDRTAGLVDSLAAGDSGGPATWIKYVRSRHDRDMKSDFIGANPGFYTSYRQDTDTVIGGVDLLRGGGEGEAYVLGLTVGHVNSDVTFDESLTTSNFKGMTYGAYASYLTDAFFVDGVVQLNRLDYDDAQSGERAKGSLTSTGAQVEAGFRIPISDGAAHIEPLASLAYVRTKFDELAYSNATFAPEDATSLRGSVGARIAGGVQFRPLTIRGSLTGRVWDEFKGDNTARLVSGGASAPLEDDFSGAFGDVGVGLSVATPDDRLAGFLSTNVKFKENFFSSDASVGVRYRW